MLLRCPGKGITTNSCERKKVEENEGERWGEVSLRRGDRVVAVTCACARNLLPRESHHISGVYIPRHPQRRLTSQPPRRNVQLARLPRSCTLEQAITSIHRKRPGSPKLFLFHTFDYCNKMTTKFYVKSVMLLVIIGFVVAAENYVDYGDDIVEKTPAENIRELYKLLRRRAALENAGFDEIPLEHLMIRKSQRSPSLRLRFGRSDPHLSMGLLSRSTIGSSRFDDK